MPRPRLLLRSLALAAALCVPLGSPASASDGVVELNQASALAGIPSIGDAAGFPVTIDRAGSYRLTSNLELAGAPAHVVFITADDVTLDLNGFVVGACIDPPGLCLSPADVNGIFSLNSVGTTVRNGMVSDVTGLGVRLFEKARVENVIVRNSGLSGILVSTDSIVRGCTVTDSAANGTSSGIVAGSNALVTDNVVSQNEGQNGISVGAGSTVEGNLVTQNQGTGITVLDGSILIRGNTVRGNSDVGMNCTGSLSSSVGYTENVFDGNDGGAEPQVLGASCVNLGGNLCKSTTNTTCP